MSRPDESSDAGSAATRLLTIINSSWTTQAIYVAAQSGISDLLADGPKTSAQLARSMGVNESSLQRLLRALTTLEIVAEREDGSFKLLPMGELLCSDAPDSVRSWTILLGRYQWPLWGHLLESVQTGESVRKLFAGTAGFSTLR